MLRGGETGRLTGAVSVLSILKNPMILMGLVSMVIFIGMPYIMDNSTASPPPPDPVTD